MGTQNIFAVLSSVSVNPMAHIAHTNTLLFSSPTLVHLHLCNKTGVFYPTNNGHSVSCTGRTTTKPEVCVSFN